MGDKMPLPHLTQEEIDAIADAVSKRMPECRCGHPDHVVHLFGRFQAIGEGNVEKGIESFSKSVEFINKVRRWGEKAGGEIAMAAVKWIVFAIIGLAAVGVWLKYGSKGAP
jgi:hypothetical protein